MPLRCNPWYFCIAEHPYLIFQWYLGRNWEAFPKNSQCHKTPNLYVAQTAIECVTLETIVALVCIVFRVHWSQRSYRNIFDAGIFASHNSSKKEDMPSLRRRINRIRRNFTIDNQIRRLPNVFTGLIGESEGGMKWKSYLSLNGSRCYETRGWRCVSDKVCKALAG